MVPAADEAPQVNGPAHRQSASTPVTSPLTFGSRVVLEGLWSPAALARGFDPRQTVMNATAPQPENAQPRTMLPPLPPQWQACIRRVDPLKGRKLVALTFDLCEGARETSGYDAGVVNYLRGERVKATFFAGGKWLRSHPEQALQLMADPLFEVGNHSWDHPHFERLPEAAITAQVLRTQAQYEALWQELARRAQARGMPPAAMDKIPRVPLTFRFPYGTHSPLALRILARLGLPAIQWDIVTGDPDRHQTAPRIAHIVLAKVQPGAIVIGHANGRGVWTADALPLFIPKLRDLGCEFVTVSELLHSGPVPGNPAAYPPNAGKAAAGGVK